MADSPALPDPRDLEDLEPGASEGLELYRLIRHRYTTERQSSMEKLAAEYGDQGVDLDKIRSWSKAGRWRQARKQNLQTEDELAAEAFSGGGTASDGPAPDPDVGAPTDDVGLPTGEVGAQQGEIIPFEQLRLGVQPNQEFLEYMEDSNRRLVALSQVLNLEVQGLVERARQYQVEMQRAESLDQAPPKPTKWIPSGAVARLLRNIKTADDIAFWQQATLARARMLAGVLRAVPVPTGLPAATTTVEHDPGEGGDGGED